ncbi:hypothetical protein MSG28_000505 [Choristoneura fumiferana]|uniref:Uncharacterized protein n=1 Tax=Choristoneura fumiferana TaxID=7141 RepID=A0ACC0K0X6_CHOFU|nr:hypothetical protein MSG28_000505 [Choristoneura fumiferana]
MSAGVSDQRMKGQGNQVTNAPKEQQLESGGDDLAEVSWRHQQQQSYAPPISSAADPYGAAGYYGTTALPYQAFGVGDGTWSTNGTDPMTFLGGYNPHDSYGMDGVFGPSTTPFSTAAFGQPASTLNYFHGNGDYSTWGQLGRNKQYDDYYRADGLYVPDGIKAVESGVQNLSLGDHKGDKDRGSELKDASGGSQPKKMTWASIASQPAKPAPSSQTTGLKKKGPGMPPPPIVPGKHNMDIGTWDAGKSAPVVTAPPPPLQQAPPVAGQLPLPVPAPVPAQPPVPAPAAAPAPAPAAAPLQRGPPPTAPPPAWSQTPRGPPPPTHQHQPRPSMPAPLPAAAPPAVPPATVLPHPVLDELRVKNDYNPKEFDLSAPNARFFVIKSYSEDDIHRSIKYEIWCSTEHGNKRLDAAYREREREGGTVYLFFSVNGSGHFCGMARMTSAVDYNSNSNVWSQDKWKGQFRVRKYLTLKGCKFCESCTAFAIRRLSLMILFTTKDDKKKKIRARCRIITIKKLSARSRKREADIATIAITAETLAIPGTLGRVVTGESLATRETCAIIEITATTETIVITANNVTRGTNAIHATNATRASNATRATKETRASNATHVTIATTASSAIIAITATLETIAKDETIAIMAFVTATRIIIDPITRSVTGPAAAAAPATDSMWCARTF